MLRPYLVAELTRVLEPARGPDIDSPRRDVSPRVRTDQSGRESRWDAWCKPGKVATSCRAQRPLVLADQVSVNAADGGIGVMTSMPTPSGSARMKCR